MHLDAIAADPEAEIARLVELGATRVADRDEYGYTWTLMADPEGNEFDLGQALLAPAWSSPSADDCHSLAGNARPDTWRQCNPGGALLTGPSSPSIRYGHFPVSRAAMQRPVRRAVAR